MSIVPTSLRARITLVAVTIVGLVLSIAAVLVFVVQQGQLVQAIDNSLDREAGEIVALANRSPDVSISDRSDDRFVQLVGVDGSVLAGSSELLRQTAAIDPAELTLDEDGLQFLSASGLPIEDDEYRVLVREVAVRGEQVIVVVGENTDDLRDSLRVLGISLAVTVPLATTLLAAVAWMLVGRTLAPVSEIRREVGRITGDELGDRVLVPRTRDEIADLAVTMNAMLDRIDHAHERQQNFVADASHELRSPITRLRTSLEADLRSEGRDLNQTGFDLVGDIEDLQLLVEDLLFLARTRHDARTDPRVVDLDAVIDRAVGQLGSSSPVYIDTRHVQPAELVGNEMHLTRLVTNLLSNAIRHARTQVWIQAQVGDGSVYLNVHDDGPGVPAQDRDRVFERFTRLDESRTTTTGGTGLGLAIAHDIVRAHRGTIHVVDSPHGGALFQVALPADRDLAV